MKWDEAHGTKYDAFRSPPAENGTTYPYRPTRVKPLDVISGDLAVECEKELMMEELDNEEVIFVR